MGCGNHPEGMISGGTPRQYGAATGKGREPTMVRRILIGTAVVALVLTVAGCGSDSDSSLVDDHVGPVSGVQGQDRARGLGEVRSRDLDLATGGKGKIDSDAQDVQDNLDALGTSVKADLKPEVDAAQVRGQGPARPRSRASATRASRSRSRTRAARSRRWARRARSPRQEAERSSARAAVVSPAPGGSGRRPRSVGVTEPSALTTTATTVTR